MKTTFWRRWLALLLALTLTLALSPAVLAAEEDGSGSDTEESTPGEDGDGGEDEQPPTPSDPPAITLISHNKPFTGTDLGNVDPGSSIPMKAGFSNGDVGNTRFTWVSADEKIARVEYHTDTPERTQEANISGVAPGETTITISCDKEGVKEVTLKVTVSGIAVLKPEISILENEAYTLKEGTDFKRFGTAAGDTAVPVLTSKNQTFVRATGSSWTNLVLDGPGHPGRCCQRRYHRRRRHLHGDGGLQPGRHYPGQRQHQQSPPFLYPGISDCLPMRQSNFRQLSGIHHRSHRQHRPGYPVSGLQIS